ncbi:hypothetical protein [Carnobacterium sp.]|uniref:hypothetical protein n=1 Tax=Carnobacterium sp. TaxID=48221 RepID=UPI0028B02E32|nr:hypothetical protein [Carnobacterium sp.]
MSDRDQQNKYNKENNISSSMYSRINVGKNNANNQLDGPQFHPIAGSLNNKDEYTPDFTSFSYKLAYYGLGLFFSLLIGFSIFYIFHDYFYGSGSTSLFSSFILFIGSTVSGFSLSNIILKKLFRKRSA